MGISFFYRNYENYFCSMHPWLNRNLESKTGKFTVYNCFLLFSIGLDVCRNIALRFTDMPNC